MLFKTRIAELLSERGWRQADLCRMTGIPTSLMSNYIKGKTSPALDNAKLIAGAFDVTLDELVGRQPRPESAVPLTGPERDLLTMFRELDDAAQQEILSYTEFKHKQKFLRETSSKEAGENYKGA